MKTYKNRNNRKKRVLNGGGGFVNPLGGMFSRNKKKSKYSIKETVDLLVDALGGMETVEGLALATRKDSKESKESKESKVPVAAKDQGPSTKAEPQEVNYPRDQELLDPAPLAAGPMPLMPPTLPAPGGGGSIARKTRRKLRRRRR